jgi:hypothetical protein
MGQHLQAIYDTRVAEGMLRPDPVQRAALLRFEELAGEAGGAGAQGASVPVSQGRTRASRGFTSGAASGGASRC